jgi:hypothetical protein
MNARQLSADLFAQDVLRCCAQAGAEACFPEHTTNFWQVPGLVRISTSRLVFLSSVLLDFRAA